MILSIKNTFVFDLDDTLYPEIDFETSGIKFVYNKLGVSSINLEKLLSNRNNWVQIILDELGCSISKDQLLLLYRNHTPDIILYEDAKRLLMKLYNVTDLYLITDGRSTTQRAKLRSLGIEYMFQKIIISEEINSEKPAKKNFLSVMDYKSKGQYVYIADNVKKDFVTPKQLGWKTICLLDRGCNIHKQSFDFPENFLPHNTINSFDQIVLSE
ncbi:HAD family hydrolase [Sediminibacterium sp. TEGAF015]|uniref:HAD family hydrolase n=1 Tax=Sediminibacterium sp. TEGAF015 TaxID=575378 RepID=UPI002204AB26|nr:HAD family hydrolase [Sediminibacterium sp. TEGAF015]BDQ13359.1 hypothetical protein TEGAF0_25760 [Sediminibacterium sp. TEGAF015]